ncbi:c-type cytochrome [Hansschlegelia zhihuaiae]|uniref:Cytochrome c n=1 Tax=Hansschlegelia zhihuaiae TaxID=405005 RepID=A0A4V1KJ70_9HYPH|nr:cytochrome c [Hansschlegelia zhihuaiae]RXF73162.1 cytochrome c [Hansschlegelia zhihuaiae]
MLISVANPQRLSWAALVAASALSLAFAPPASALEPRAQRGQTFAKTHCAMCHAIGPRGASPLKIAPPFRTLHERYPVETLAEAFAEGIQTGHPSMPQFRLDSAEITDLIAYLKSLESAGP